MDKEEKKTKLPTGFRARESCWRRFRFEKVSLQPDEFFPRYGFSATPRNRSNRTHLRFWHVDWVRWKQGWFTGRGKNDEPRLLPRLPYWGSGGCRNCCLPLIRGLFFFFFRSHSFVKRFLFPGLETSELLECLPAFKFTAAPEISGHSVGCSGSSFDAATRIETLGDSR